jgi:hypothetical protein
VRRQLTFSIVADGGTDRSLIPILQWALHRLDPEVDLLEPEFVKRRGSVREFLAEYDTTSMLTFVHRDAETMALDERHREFIYVDRSDVVPVVPVRMTEAWLLIDGHAIARAADRPTAVVDVRSVTGLENLADPKQVLEELLMNAAGDLTGRRRRKFRASLIDRRVNLAFLIADYSPLEGLSAFRRFQEELAAIYPYGL